MATRQARGWGKRGFLGMHVVHTACTTCYSHLAGWDYSLYLNFMIHWNPPICLITGAVISCNNRVGRQNWIIVFANNQHRPIRAVHRPHIYLRSLLVPVRSTFTTRYEQDNTIQSFNRTWRESANAVVTNNSYVTINTTWPIHSRCNMYRRGEIRY